MIHHINMLDIKVKLASIGIGAYALLWVALTFLG